MIKNACIRFNRFATTLNRAFLMKSLVTLFVSLFSITSFAQSVDTTLEFFKGALQVHVVGPQSLVKGRKASNPFIIQVNDSHGTPYPLITKQWVSATVEMTSMDMGIDEVDNLEDVLDANNQYQGQIKFSPIFSMMGPWKLNLSITVSDDNGQPMTDTQSVTFDVNK